MHLEHEDPNRGKKLASSCLISSNPDPGAFFPRDVHDEQTNLGQRVST